MFSWVDQFDLILLDFDGLLVNTEFLHYSSYKKMVESLGFSFPIDYPTYCSGAHISLEALKNLIYLHCEGLNKAYPDWMTIRELKQKIYLSELNQGHLSLMPGVEELIHSIHFFNKKACIVTNSPLSQIELIEQKLKILKTIPFKITRELYTHPKPSADSYLKAIEFYASVNDRIIGFEDTPKGIEALKNAKLFAVEISREATSPIADLHFKNFFQVNFAST